MIHEPEEGKIRFDKIKIEADLKWMCCPLCGQHLIKVMPSTELKNMVIHCKHCKQQMIINMRA